MVAYRNQTIRESGKDPLHQHSSFIVMGIIPKMKCVHQFEAGTEELAESRVGERVRRMGMDDVDLLIADNLQKLQERKVVGSLEDFRRGDTHDVHAGAMKIIPNVASLFEMAHADVEQTAIESVAEVLNYDLGPPDPQIRNDD
jgi:hypothetical protein